MILLVKTVSPVRRNCRAFLRRSREARRHGRGSGVFAAVGVVFEFCHRLLERGTEGEDDWVRRRRMMDDGEAEANITSK